MANYILNLALTLQDYLNKNRNQNVTATLILKGRVPLFDIEKKLSVIEKLRGEPSPINPSPVPEVEIIYGISIPTTKEEFYFTLKQGRKTRLAKSNKKLQSKAAKEKYCQLKKIRSYLVIDKLINYASNEIEDYLSFINKFWVGFEEESEPTKNVPKWENFKEAKDKEEELLPIVSNKVNEFLKNTKVKDKKVNNEKVLTYVKSIAESVSNQEGLCFLDWNHIIVDAIKNKNYNKKRDEINIITPTILEKKNTYKDLFRNNCFLKFEKKDSNFLLTASEVPFIKETTNENNEIFNNIFFNILLIYFQLNIDKDYLKNYLSFVLSKIKTNKFNPFFKFKACLEDFKNSENKPKSEDFKNPENKPKSKELALLYADLSAVFNQVKDVSKKELIEEVKNIYSILDNAITERKAQEIQEESLVDNEEEIIKILTKTPLHSDISLSNIYCCLNKYKSKKLQNIKENECPFLDQLISLIQFDKSINVKFLYFFRIFFKPKNIVQYIYTIDEKDNVYVAHDDLVKRDQRPTHSELAHGCGVKAAGEMIFIKQKEKKEDEGENWYLHVINNGSGHYRPAAHKCLPTANDIIAPKLEENGIKKSSTFSLLNSLRPGMTLASGWDDLVESEEGSPRSEL